VAGAIQALVAGLLTFCVLFDPTAGSLTWLDLERASVKKAVDRHIIAGIEASDLVLLEFSREETGTLLRWEHAREFEYDGQMYDVVETWAVGDTVFFRCWWDREETALNARMRVIALRAFGDAPRIGDLGGPSVLAPRSPLFVPSGAWTFPAPGSSDSLARALSIRYTSFDVTPPTPPPRPA
jgi:hypothetical protein